MNAASIVPEKMTPRVQTEIQMEDYTRCLDETDHFLAAEKTLIAYGSSLGVLSIESHYVKQSETRVMTIDR